MFFIYSNHLKQIQTRMVFRVFQLLCWFVSTPKKLVNTWNLHEFSDAAVSIPCEQWKKKPGCLGFIGNEILPSYIGITINHYIYGSLLINQVFFIFMAHLSKSLRLGVNHLGHYALCGVLLPFLGRSDRPTRVVSVSSLAHRLGNPVRLLQEHWSRHQS